MTRDGRGRESSGTRPPRSMPRRIPRAVGHELHHATEHPQIVCPSKRWTFHLQRWPAAISSLSCPQQPPNPRELPPDRECPLQSGSLAGPQQMAPCTPWGVPFSVQQLDLATDKKGTPNYVNSHRIGGALFSPAATLSLAATTICSLSMASRAPHDPQSTSPCEVIWVPLFSPATRPCHG